ncbi:MAG: CCC motif membrane protein [Bacteroidota bacterium]
MSEEQIPQENPQQHNPFQQQNPFPPQNGGMGFNGMQQPLPNATIVLILGILSILTCCCFYGIIGLVLSIVALVLSKKDRALYAFSMGSYTEGSFKNLNAGRVCAIIGLILNIIILLASVIFIAVFGWAAITDQEAMKEIFQNMQ